MGLMTAIGSWLLLPFSSQPAAGLLFWSVVAGIAISWLFAKSSNQQALGRAADRVRAQLLAVKLFKDDLTVTMRCQIVLMKATGVRLWHSLPPMLVMFIPFLIVLPQLALRYDYRPLLPGESAVLAVRLKPESWKEHQDVTLEPADGVVLETESLRDDKSQTLFWRIRADGERTTQLQFQFGDLTVEKQLSIASSSRVLQATSVKRVGATSWERLLHPGEPGFASDSPVASIHIQHQLRETAILGYDIPWWATFFLVSMVVAFVVGKFTGVQY